MTRIRDLRTDDLPQVVSLYRAHLARPHVATHEELVASFANIFLDAPLYDPSIPSLVWEDPDGAVVGFLGSQIHRMRLDDQPVRLACSSSLVVAPRARQRGVGALLLRKYLAGLQDVTITDSAGDDVQRMWTRLGGSTLPLASVTWLYPIDPARTVGGLILWRFGRLGWLPVLRPLCRPVDAAVARRRSTDVPGGVDDLTEEPLSPESMIEHLCLGPGSYRLWPDYDVDSLERLLREVARSRAKGRLVKAIVRGPAGEPIGWYLMSLAPNDVCRVLHLAASPGSEELVVHHVLRRAQQLGAAAVRGQMTPWLLEVLPRGAVLFRWANFLYHAHDDAIDRAIRDGDALLTGLEGDMWLPT